MLAFWGNNEVLTTADCTNPSKRLNRVVSNFIVTVTKPYHSNIAVTKRKNIKQLDENEAI